MKKILFFAFSFGLVYFAKSATITPAATGSNLKWSLPSSWKDGIKPQTGDEVIIPSGRSIILDQNIDVKSILVEGSLVVDVSKDINIRAEYIMLMGATSLFQWGTEAIPYTNNGSITLVGTDPTAEIAGHGVSSKAIMVMNGAKLELHGAKKKSWTQLNKTALINTNQLVLKENVNWEVGDSIVIASTDFDMNQAEMHAVKKVTGNIVDLEGILKFNHFGELQNYTHGLNSNIKWTLDERAEVGLLSKSIKIQGDASSAKTGFGGHIMVMVGSNAKVENVELARMGQKQKLGRYPFHWHALGDANGQYFNNNSVHHTYNRAITVHATNNVGVNNNVCFDNVGHAFFLEDGVETGVIMTGNLGLVTRRPVNIGDPATREARQTSMLPSDTLNARNASGPSTFWITNPNNNVTGNHAAGSDGSGIWYSPFVNKYRYPVSPLPYNAVIPDGFIDDNVVHSNNHGFLFGVSTRPSSKTEEPLQLIDENFSFDPPANSLPTVRNMLMYKNNLGAYMRTRPTDAKASKFINMIVADNRVGEAATWKTFIDSSLWVLTSKNYTPFLNIQNVGGGPKVAHIIYDGPTIITNSHFGGDTLLPGSPLEDKVGLFDQWGGNLKYTGHSLTNTTVAPSALYAKMRSVQGDKNSVWVAATIRDHDGKFLKKGAGVTIMRDISIMYDASTAPITSTGNTRYGNIKLGYLEFHNSDHTNNGNGRSDFTRIIRSDGPQYGDLASISGFPISPILNKGYSYRLMFKEQIASRMQSTLYSMDGGDTMRYEIPNVPSTIKVYIGDEVNYGELALNANKKAFQKVANKTSLNASTKSAYTWENGTVYVKYVAPAGLSYQSANAVESIFFCLYNDCVNGDHERVIISDFVAKDTRGDLVYVAANVTVSAISNSVGKDSYTITKKGASDACVDYSLNLETQNWEGIFKLNISSAGLLGSEVFIKDVTTLNPIKLGAISKDNGYTTFILPTAVSQIDQVTEIIIRTCESNITIPSKTIAIDEISLGDVPPGVIASIENDFSEEDQVVDVKIFPNPSNDGIFNLSQTASWKVTSILGKELKSGNGNQINISEYPKGIYLVKMNEKVERVVVE